jgi:YidC/Oxa1 family membrane protein insertase
VAIILLTLAVKFITFPLTIKQLRTTREMQRHKPAIDEINLRNRANPAKKQAELMEYYKKNNVNPFGAVFGCLPMFLQMPVFISLFVVLGRAVELRYAPFVGWITDLSSPDVILAAVKIPVIFPQGLTILPFLMTATTYFQTKQTITDPNQKMMIYLMPGMMFLFSSVMPSGLILYWIVSNLFSIVQFMIMNRTPLTLVMPAHPHMQNKARKNSKS